MNEPPTFQQSPEISVTAPVSLAYERVKQMLFKPFDLAKWVTIGFCAWLAGLGEMGGTSFNYSNGNHQTSHNHGSAAEQFRYFYWEARHYLADNFYWILPLAVLVILLSMAIWGLLIWLNSRGKFMFLHCVTLDKAEVAIPWSKYAKQSNSLFWFRMIFGLIGGLAICSALALGCVAVISMLIHDQVNPLMISLLVMLVLGMIALLMILSIIRKFLVDFVLPIMFLRNINCLSAWREFLKLASSFIGQFALYILFQIVLSLAIAVMVLVVVLLTCCCAGCLMALPFIGTVVLLPVLVFKRAYPLHYLAQFGQQYDVFQIPVTSQDLPA